MKPAKSMACSMPPEEESGEDITMDNIHGYQADVESSEPDQMQQSTEIQFSKISLRVGSGDDKVMDFPLLKEKDGKIESLMRKKGITFDDFHSPADYSSDEEVIAHSKAMLTKDITQAIELFNLGY